MHEDAFQLVFAGDAQQGIEVLLVGVHAAIRDQPEEVELASAFARALHGLHDGRVFLEFAGRDGHVDARDVHLHDAAGADVQVAHFAVAHLAVGQADKMLRRANERVGKLAEQLVVRRLAGQGDGVVGGFGTNHSVRTGVSWSQPKRSRMPPRTANCPRFATRGTRS